MSITIKDILNAASVGETSDWEFKKAKGGFPGTFWDTYSAFGNSEGGTIVLGVSEVNGVATVEGLDLVQARQHEKTIWDSANNRQKVSVNLLAEASQVRILPFGPTYLVCVFVPAAGRTQRPVHLGSTPFGNTYRRRAEGDYRVDDLSVRRMLADADPIPADHRILQHFGLNDLDRPSLTQYRQRFRAAKGDHAWLALDDKELLIKLGGWRTDRTNGKEGLTLAGLLMFGKDQAIRDPEAAPQYYVDFREKLDPIIRWTDRVHPDGTFEANLFQFYQRVWPKLAEGLKQPFQLEGDMRKDESPAHESLREAFVNALIHADYGAKGGIVVERYPERYEFSNPGVLLVSLEQFRAGGVSECRNKSLQQMFQMIGGGERAGSGVDKIRTGWHTRHWRTPLITRSFEPDRIKLTLPMISLVPESTLAHLNTLFGPRVGRLTSAQLQALATAEIEGSVSNVRLQELVKEHPSDITRVLQALCEEGLLLSDNKRRWTTYRLPDKGKGNMPDKEGGKQPTGEPVALGVGKAAESGLMPDKGTLMPDKGKQLADSPKRRTRISPEDTKAQILALCKGQYLTAKELAQRIGKNHRYLSNNFIYPLVREGQLRPQFPSTRRKDQAYITATP